MAADRDPDDLRQVAAQAGWVRRLAVELARDVHAGEDVAQDALLAATRGHPQSGSLTAWLAGAVRNLARLRLRSEDRRETRERRAARPERVDDPTLALERLELQEALLGAVRGLPEPYRTSVLLRWFEQLEPEEIARRTSTPVRTVHTRLQRALGLLRETLDRRSQGDRSRWLAAWLPTLSHSSPGWKWVLLMELKTKLAIAGLVAAGALSIWIAVGVHGNTAVPQITDASSPALALDALATDQLPSERPGEGRRAVESAEAPRGAPAGARAARTLHGTVIDVNGAKLPGIQVVFRGEPASQATSDAEGAFSIEIAANGELDVEAPDWVSVYETAVELPDPIEGYCLVLAKPRIVRGSVRDQSGGPVAGAQVSFGPVERHRYDFVSRYSDPLRKRLGLALEASAMRAWGTVCPADGDFVLTTARIPGLQLNARHPHYQSVALDLPEDDAPLTIVLTPNVTVRPNVLHGRIVDPTGKGVYGAWLRLGTLEARSDPDGGFNLGIDDRAELPHILAVHPDWLPATQPCLTESAGDPGAWPNPLVIAFRESIPGIGGVVHDADGRPVKDVEVLALDPPTWGEVLGRMGESSPKNADRSDSVLGEETVRTDESGRFHLRGLNTRAYRLLARGKRTLDITISDPIQGGTLDAVLVLGDPEGRCRHGGTLVDLRGEPIVGARISAMRILAKGTRVETDEVMSDDRGRFEFQELSRNVEGFIVLPEWGPAETVPFDRSMPRDSLRLHVGRVARVRVRIATPGLEVDSVAFLDSNGKPLPCGMKLGRGGWCGGGEHFETRGSGSEVLIVSERARTLVLSSQGKEVQRLPLHLDPAQVNLVRP